MAHIRLTREGVALEEVQGQQVWPLKITATVLSDAMPSAKIFVYHASMGDDAYEGDLFECVASIQQYTDIPEDGPLFEDGNLVVPYYRLNVLNFACRSPDENQQLWEDIQEDVADLVRNYVALNEVAVMETVDI